MQSLPVHFSEHFHKIPLCLFIVNLCSYPQPQTIYFLTINFPFLNISHKQWYNVFFFVCVWILAFSIITFLRFIHVAYISIVFAFLFYFWILYIVEYTTFCLSSPVDGYLCFHFLAILNDAAVNICLPFFVWTYVFVSPR